MENVQATRDTSQITLSGIQYDALVLDARLRQSLATVRSLGSRGMHVAALETFDTAPTFSSRWCEQKFVCPASEGTPEYLAYLKQVLEATGARVLISCSDGTIALIRQHRQQLEQRTHIALAKESALGIAINKEQTLEIAKRLGVRIPHAITIGRVDEVETALREIGLPAVIKPVESWAGDKHRGVRIVSELVTTPEEARCAVETLTRFGGTVLFQQYLLGRRESLSFFYANGKMYARYAFWGQRTEPPLGGTYVLRQSIALPPDTGKQAERLVREIGLEGYSQVEFRRDSAGTPYLMEINPRLNLAIETPIRAGVDFPYLLYQWARGESLEEVKSYRIGTRMRYLAGDILTTAASVRQPGRPGIASPARAIFDFFLSFFVPTRYDYLDLKDPLPAWVATKGFVRFALRLIRREIWKKKLQ